jgi:ArsR family transcriptional regulator
MPTLSGSERRRLAQCCHALSDETRLKILDRLSAGERCVCELTAAVGATQPRLSFHLKTLKDAGLVRDRPEGRWVYYSVDATAATGLRGLLERLTASPRHGLPVVVRPSS